MMTVFNRLARVPRRFAGILADKISELGEESQGKLQADAEEFWSASEGQDQIRDLSHWLGEGRWADATEWERIGKTHLAMFHRLLQMAGSARSVSSVVEWGQGGGANAAAFLAEVDDYYGVDISRANLDECANQMAKRGLSTFHPVHIDAGAPEQCLTSIDRPVDMFLSTAVYQHFPSKEYGARVTRLACDMLADDGLALIQTRYDDQSKRLRSKARDYKRNVVFFTSYRVEEFWAVAASAGLRPLAVVLDPAPRYAYYFLRKEKAQATPH